MKRLTLVPIGGLANRMLAINSAIAFCQDNRIRLKIIWFKDKGMGTDFHALFEMAPALKNIEVIDAKWTDYRFDRPRKRNLWLPFLWQLLYFDRRIYEMETFVGLPADKIIAEINNHNNTYFVYYYSFYENGINTYLKPDPCIQSLINDKTASMANHRVVGVHIRRGDHILSINNSPLHVFIDAMEKEIRKYPDTRFFLASDSVEEKEKLIAQFGDRITSTLDPTNRDSHQGIVDAMKDLYILSKCTKIYGSKGSTFSFLAAKLTNIPLQILSIEETISE